MPVICRSLRVPTARFTRFTAGALLLGWVLVACGSGSASPAPAMASPIASRPDTATRVPTIGATDPVAPAGAASGPATDVPAGGGPAGMPPPDHIFLIIMENREVTSILGNPSAPFINQLAAQYAVADRYYAITHPSLPNYLSLVGGDTFGVTSDCTTCFQGARNLADTLEARGRSWKSYQEGLPAPCFLGAQAGEYAMKHDPFIYFTDIRTNPARCRRTVPLSQLSADLAGGAVPNFAWITPNLTDDMHDGSVADGDQWLRTWVPKIMQSPAWQQHDELVITWDEGETNDGCCGDAAGGRIPLLVIAPDGPKGYRATTPATHYTLLRTIEDQWGLERLGHSGDPGVQPLWDLVRPPAVFALDAIEQTSHVASHALADLDPREARGDPTVQLRQRLRPPRDGARCIAYLFRDRSCLLRYGRAGYRESLLRVPVDTVLVVKGYAARNWDRNRPRASPPPSTGAAVCAPRRTVRLSPASPPRAAVRRTP